MKELIKAEWSKIKSEYPDSSALVPVYHWAYRLVSLAFNWLMT